MLAILVSYALSTDVRIVNNSISSHVIWPGDTIYIDGSGKTTNVHVQSHYFCGKLTFLVNSSDTKNWELNPSEGSCYSFVDSIIKITYSGMAAVKLSIFLIPSEYHSYDGIFSSKLRSSSISISNQTYSQKFCVFYEFPSTVSFSSSLSLANSSATQISVIQSFTSGATNQILLNSSGTSTQKLNPSFFLCSLAPISNEDSIVLWMSTDSPVADWTDTAMPFISCRTNGTCNNSYSVPSFFSENRAPKWWIWAILATVIVLILVPVVIMLCPGSSDDSDQTSAYWMGSLFSQPQGVQNNLRSPFI